MNKNFKFFLNEEDEFKLLNGKTLKEFLDLYGSYLNWKRFGKISSEDISKNKKHTMLREFFIYKNKKMSKKYHSTFLDKSDFKGFDYYVTMTDGIKGEREFLPEEVNPFPRLYNVWRQW